jgi:hypothetical protein
MFSVFFFIFSHSKKDSVLLPSVLRIRIRIHWIHRIHMFLDLPDPDPLLRGMDLHPDPSVIMQK